ncbi:hypothetical protein LCGC14_1724310 [marine sediment metagenome]|uniref:Uncharacterized protein n=1 Tax=marine sediment metagenome TaxID=412755 RepID=A0A0F9KB73_9ZZZZ
MIRLLISLAQSVVSRITEGAAGPDRYRGGPLTRDEMQQLFSRELGT